ncbi:MAG TPA: pilus assembly protein PilM [Tepidisphaeraceae bacterium]|jgi:type IV pilus assembly protein PilM|nr:pilus assembly protein PilM [Tepidisphaeraceae bacterium]
MLNFVNNWFAAKANPIGVDFGTDAIRLAQVQWVDGDYKLAAAATADVPSHVRNDPKARAQFFIESMRDLLAQGKFRGRQVVLSLPAASLHMQHLRLAKMDDAALKKAIPWESRGKFPMEPGAALVRHMIAGEINADTDPKLEVIVMAASKATVSDYLAAAAKSRLDVVGMHVEPRVLVDCFAQVYRRKSDADTVNAFIDIGAAGTRMIVSRGQQIFFARSVPIGGNHFTAAVASALKMNFEDAKLMRMRLANVAPATPELTPAATPAPLESIAPASTGETEGFALLTAGLNAAAARLDDRHLEQPEPASTEITNPITPATAAGRFDPAAEERNEARKVDQACRDLLNKLIEELELCRRYFEGTFPSKPVERLIFVGGEARQRTLCQHIARQMQLAAQLGDPLVRMARSSEIGMETGIDRRQPQPSWAVAIGLSMGAAAAVGVEA